MNKKSRNHTDPMLQLARNALRQTNVSLFQTTVKRILYKLPKVIVTPLEASLAIVAAELLRAGGQSREALALLRPLLVTPVPGATEILSQAERLHVALLLDMGEFSEAYAVASAIDALVIENSEPGAASLTHRNPAEVSIETLLTEAEANIFSGRIDEAVQIFASAIQKLALEEARTSELKINSYELKEKYARFSNLRYELHFWGAVVKIIGADMEAYDTLGELVSKIQNDPAADKRLLAKIRAVQGEFDIDAGISPVGIGILEAMRLWNLASGQTLANTATELFSEISDTSDAPQLLSSGAPADLPVLATANTVPVQLLEEQNTNITFGSGTDGHSHSLDLQNKFALLIDKFSQVLDKLPLQTATPPKDTRRPFAFGGGFRFVDLMTWLEEAENTGLTGFFLVQWNPDLVETSILAGNLHPSARAGEGFIFFRDGIIIDACLGNYDADPQLPAGTPEAEADAKRNLKTLLQIGTAKKLDQEPEGFGEAYPSMAVKHRAVRFEFAPSEMMLLIIEIDNELREES